MTQFIVFQELTNYENLDPPLSVASLIVEATDEEEAASKGVGSGLIMQGAAIGVVPIMDRKTYGVEVSPVLTEQPSL